MFEWLFNLLRDRRGASRRGPFPEGAPSLDPYPTPDTARDWDDASLFAAAGCASALRYGKVGFENLNDVERSLCCLYLLEAEVNNGGFGQWIWNVCPNSATATPVVLRMIGAIEMASFIADVLLLMGDVKPLKSKEEWIEHYHALPDEVHDHMETLTRPFLELEEPFLELAYSYTRANWEAVQTA